MASSTNSCWSGSATPSRKKPFAASATPWRWSTACWPKAFRTRTTPLLMRRPKGYDVTMLTIEYTAQLRRAAGVAVETIDLSEGCTLQQLARALADRHGQELR